MLENELCPYFFSESPVRAVFLQTLLVLAACKTVNVSHVIPMTNQAKINFEYVKKCASTGGFIAVEDAIKLAVSIILIEGKRPSIRVPNCSQGIKIADMPTKHTYSTMRGGADLKNTALTRAIKLRRMLNNICSSVINSILPYFSEINFFM
jgi:hypothetical protein